MIIILINQLMLVYSFFHLSNNVGYNALVVVSFFLRNKEKCKHQNAVEENEMWMYQAECDSWLW